MENTARLIDVAVPRTSREPQGAVIVLHGGASRRSRMRVSPAQLSVLRMLPVAHRIARRSSGRLLVQRLLNSSRGWDSDTTPVDDAAWALEQVVDRLGPQAPVALVGHSLGGRAAVLAAVHPSVRAVVALNAFVHPTDGRLPLVGRRVLFVHGESDRVARPGLAEAVARDLERTARVAFVSIADGSHSMLRHHAVFDGLAADFTASVLLDDGPRSDTVRRVLEGEERVRVTPP